MRLFEEAVSSTDAPMSSQSAMMYAYGIYLSNGGRPSDFLDLTFDDVQIMLTSYLGTLRRERRAEAEMLVKMFGGAGGVL